MGRGGNNHVLPLLKANEFPSFTPPHPRGWSGVWVPVSALPWGGAWGAMGGLSPPPALSSRCSRGPWDAGEGGFLPGREGKGAPRFLRGSCRLQQQQPLLIFVLSALFSDINGTSEDINYQLTAAIVRGLWVLMISLVLKKLL